MAKNEETGETKRTRKAGTKSALRAEVERVAKQYGLPPAYVQKQVTVRLRELASRHRAERERLVSEVNQLVRESLKEAINTPEIQ